MDEFPRASDLIVKPKEEFVSLVNVLGIIKNVVNQRGYEVILEKGLSPPDIAFLELKGYQVSPGGKEFGPKISWPKSEAPKPDPKLSLDELIDFMDEAMLKNSITRVVFLPHSISYDTFRRIRKAFPGYSFQGEPSIINGAYISWCTIVAGPSERVNFCAYVEIAVKKSPETGSKKYGMAASIPDAWLQSLSSEFPRLLFSLAVENTGRKESRVLRWCPKPTKTPESDLSEKVISKLGLYPPIGRLILKRVTNTEGLNSMLSFCDFFPKGTFQIIVTFFVAKLTPPGTADKIRYMFEGDFSGNIEAEKIRRELIEIAEKNFG
jgi:hypothetical protein